MKLFPGKVYYARDYGYVIAWKHQWLHGLFRTRRAAWWALIKFSITGREAR